MKTAQEWVGAGSGKKELIPENKDCTQEFEHGRSCCRLFMKRSRLNRKMIGLPKQRENEGVNLPSFNHMQGLSLFESIYSKPDPKIAFSKCD